MSLPAILCAAAAALALTASGALGLVLIAELPPVSRGLTRYRAWWAEQVERLRADPRLRKVPALQLRAAPALLVDAYASGLIALLPAALLVLIGPPLMLRDRARRRRDALAAQLDSTLTGLANALATTPNLGEAIRTLLDTLEDPMRAELAAVLGEVRVGRPIDDALTALASRSGIPGFTAAVAAAIMGRRTGGDLPAILRRTAATLREMARLEGVVRTKTAEGRAQSLVMGLVPPLLILALHKIDPGWLAPLWHDPIGWIILGLGAIFEVAAIALIRRIMAVDL